MDRAYPLTSVLCCGSCGCRPYYRCTSIFKKHWDACDIKQVNADKIDAWVEALIEALAASPELVDGAVAKANEERLPDLGPLQEKLAEIRARVTALEGEARNLVVVLKELGPSALGSVREELTEVERAKTIARDELAEVEETIRGLKTSHVDEGRVKSVLADFRLLYEAATPKERGELVRLLFKRLTLNGAGNAVQVELWDRRVVDLDGSKARTTWLRE